MALTDIDKILAKAVKAATSSSTLNKVGKEMVERVKRRTRLGKGVSKPEGTTNKLPELKPKTVDNRRGLKRAGRLTGQGATPKKSGVNRSGEMLDSLDYKVESKKVNIELGRTQERKAEDLVRLNADYQFMNLSKPEANAAAKIIDEEIQKAIK